MAFAGIAFLSSISAIAAVNLSGQVLGGGAPVANSTVTLWAASAGAPKELSQARTDADGHFTVVVPDSRGADDVLYLVAQHGQAVANRSVGDNSAIALMTVIGTDIPPKVTINEFTTVASVWTHNQFLEGTALKGHALGLHIAAGNMPNFVDLATGGYGGMIQDGFNSTQTPTMANFATLASVVAGCVTQVKADACTSLFAASTGPDGNAPTDTLAALHSIAHNAAYKPERVFALLDVFYPVPAGQTSTPDSRFMPYLSFAPGAWVLPLKFAGGGYSGGAKGDVRQSRQRMEWRQLHCRRARDKMPCGMGTSSEVRPQWPSTFADYYRVYQVVVCWAPDIGTAIDAERPRVDGLARAGETISLFDHDRQSQLSPPEGYNFGGKLGIMQGIIVTPDGDVWALDFGNDRVVYLPKGDPGKAKFYCEAPAGTPNKDGPCKLNGPFHLAIDQQDRIWITNAISDTVTRFPAGDPSRGRGVQGRRERQGHGNR